MKKRRSLSYYLIPTKNKRVKIAVGFGISNLAALLLLSFLTEHDIMAIGGALAAINTPIYGYLFAETYRPTETKPNENEE